MTTDFAPSDHTFQTIEMTCDEDGVAMITLNRPAGLNAFTPERPRHLHRADDG